MSLQEKRMTRRGFLRFSGLAIGSLLLSPIPDVKPPITFEPRPNSHIQHHQMLDASQQIPTEKQGHTESKSTLAELVDTATAVPIAGLFASYVGMAAAEKTTFNERTAGSMLLAEAARLLVRSTVDSEGASEEGKEIVKSIAIASFLSLLAEIASRTRVSVESLLQKNHVVRDAVKALALEDVHEGQHELPAFKELSLEECEQKLEDYKEEVLRLNGGNAAITMLLAPLATTYASASASADIMPPMLRALTKAYSAQEIIEHKKAGEDFDEQNIREQSLKKALKQINGPWGYLNMNLALAANTSGMGIIGDPPLFFSLARHPKVFSGLGGFGAALTDHMVLSAEGLTYSTFANMAMNREWLKRTGLFQMDVKTHAHIGAEYMKHFRNGLQALLSSPFNSKIRDVMWFGTQEYSRQLTELLSEFEHTEDGSQIQEIKGLLKSIPHPIVEFNVNDFVRDFVSSVQKLSQNATTFLDKLLAQTQNPAVQKAAEELIVPEDTEPLAFIQAVPNKKERQSQIERLHAQKVKERTQELSHVLHDILTNGRDTTHTSSQIQSIRNFIRPVDSHVMSMFEDLIETPDSVSIERLHELEQLVGTLGPSDVQTAVTTMLDTYRGIKLRESEERSAFFGPVAKDVMFALFTQLPAVPSLARLAGVTLDAFVGLDTPHEEQEKIPEWKIDAATGVVLSVTGGESGVADNAAAYLFGATGLQDFYEKVYKSFPDNPSLQAYANNAPLFMAITGGSLTKIGNGPNFQLEEIQADLQGNVIDISHKPLTLLRSAKNPYAGFQNAVLLTYLTAQRRFVTPKAA